MLILIFVEDGLTTTNNTNCISCPPACHGKSYEISLSQSEFSDFSVDSVMSNSTEIQDRFFDAIEIRNRVNESSMSIVIGLLEELLLRHSQLKSALNLNVVNSQTSVIARLYLAQSTFVASMQADVDAFGIFLEPFENHYKMNVWIFLDNFLTQLNELWLELTLTTDFPVFTNSSLDVIAYAFFITLATSENIDCSVYSTRQSLYISDDGLTCQDILTNVFLSISSGVLFTPDESYGLVYGVPVLNSYNIAAVNSLISLMPILYTCQTEYGNVLGSMRSWINSVQLDATLPSPPNYKDFLDPYVDDEIQLRSMIDRYASYNLTMLQMAGELTGVLARISSELTNVTSAMTSISSAISSSIISFANSVSTTLKTMTADLNTLNKYNNNSYSTNFARGLAIWNSPYPQIDSSQVSSLRFTSYRHILWKSLLFSHHITYYFFLTR